MRPNAINALVSLTAVLGSSTLAAATVVESGHTAAWYNPARNGEGWVLEILDDDRAAVYWFTYDDEGDQRWMTGAGEVAEDANGRYIRIPELIATHGARFGDGFDPDDVVSEVVGSATFRFDDCQTGKISYTAFGESSEASLQRLARTMGAGCSPLNGIPGEPVKDYAGQSGDWYDPSHEGEGFTMQWLTRDQALAYWFTYDDEGNQAWMFGVGNYVDGVIKFPTLQATGGARFGAGFDPDDVQLIDWGTMTMDLACDTGAMSYASELPAFGEGGQDLERLSRLASPVCPYVKPLLTDLYDLELVELPMPEDNEVVVRSIADDGTVLGFREIDDENVLVALRPGSDAWETLGGPAVDRSQAVLISPDGARAYAGETDLEETADFQPIEWMLDDGSEPLPGFGAGPFELIGGSRNRTVLAGRTDNPEDDSRDLAWTWDVVRGLQSLPGNEPFSRGTVATSAADDGRVTVGYERFATLSLPPGTGRQTGREALRWVDGVPERLLDEDGNSLSAATTTSADGAVIFGLDANGLPDDSPRAYQPWYWTDEGAFGVLEVQEADQASFLRYTPVEASADGSLAIGLIPNLCICSPVPPPEGFIWTQVTEVVHTRDLLKPFEGDGISPYGYRTVSVSSAGDLVLLSSSRDEAAVLVLTPKSE